MQSDRSRLRELEIRVANPQHWSSGEHQINVENLRQLRFQIEDQLKKLRQQTQASALNSPKGTEKNPISGRDTRQNPARASVR